MTELIRDRIASLIREGIQLAQNDGALPPFEIPEIGVERPRQEEHGDYATPSCLQLAGQTKMAPRDIATAIVEHLPA
ncbi:MAG: arginine--tRNA ligase, partial [Anaerolineae bacterium]